MSGWVGTMSLATSCDITRHHAIRSGRGSGAGGVRHHSTEGVAEERRGGGSGSGGQTGVGSGSGRRAGVGSVRGSPYTPHRAHFRVWLPEHHLRAQIGTLVVSAGSPLPPTRHENVSHLGCVFISGYIPSSRFTTPPSSQTRKRAP